jgi:hypothetical protein
VQGWGLIRLVQGQECDFLFCVSGFQVFCIVRLFISAADGWRGCSTLLRAVLTMRSWIWSRWQAWGWIAAYIVRDDRSVLSSGVPADKNPVVLPQKPCGARGSCHLSMHQTFGVLVFGRESSALEVFVCLFCVMENLLNPGLTTIERTT